LLRLINAARLAPLEELLAEVRSGAPVSSGAARGASAGAVDSGMSRGVFQAPASARAPQVAPTDHSMGAIDGGRGLSVELKVNKPVLYNETRHTERTAPSVVAQSFGTSAPSAAVSSASVAAEEFPDDVAAPNVELIGIATEQVAEIKEAIQSQQ